MTIWEMYETFADELSEKAYESMQSGDREYALSVLKKMESLKNQMTIYCPSTDYDIGTMLKISNKLWHREWDLRCNFGI